MQRRKYYSRFMAILFTGMISWCVACKVDISSYTGDGMIRTLSDGFFSRGFEVEFDEFSMATPYSSDYSLDGLPNVEKDHFFLLRLFDTLGNLKMNQDLLDSIVLIEVKTVDGDRLTKVRSALRGWRRTSSSDPMASEFYVFSGAESSLVDYQEIRGKDLSVRFEYSPVRSESDSLQSLRGTLILKVGGYK